jgi:hypothetical protein
LAHLRTVLKLHKEPLCVDRSTGAADSYGYRFHHFVLYPMRNCSAHRLMCRLSALELESLPGDVVAGVFPS